MQTGSRFLSYPLVVVAMAIAIAAADRGLRAVGPRDAADLESVVLSNPRVVVLKSARLLHLFDGDRLIRTYPVDLGQQPQGTKQIGVDRKTPEGRFRIVHQNPVSPYARFLGLDYPDESAIESGLSEGLISVGQAESLRAALRRGERPDWTTALGGGVGIHGRRRGDDWTGGCIAISDENMEELFRVLRIGDPVEILP